MSWSNPRYCYLHAARDAGAAGAIVGRALYTGSLDLKEALDALC